MRARNIKPGFYLNEALAECSFPARLLFPGLWMLADREGRLEYRPKRWKAELFPYDNVDPAELFAELEEQGLVRRYSAGTMELVWIPKFSTHQNPHIKEKASEFPAHPDENPMLEQELPEQEPDEHGASTVQAQCKHGSSTSVARLIPDSGFLIPDSSPLTPQGDDGGDLPPVDPPQDPPAQPKAKKRTRTGETPLAYSPEFESAWKVYPCKSRKGSAWAAWQKALLRGMSADRMPEIITARAKMHDWQKEGGQYVPHFATWLNANGWEDEVTPLQSLPSAWQSILSQAAVN